MGDSILPNILYDKGEASRHTNEMCSSIQDQGLPTYVHFQTVTQAESPGVCLIHEAKDPMPFGCFLQRTWHRVMNLFLK